MPDAATLFVRHSAALVRANLPELCGDEKRRQRNELHRFLKSKVVVAPKGFAIDRGQQSGAERPSKDAVQWAIAGGRRALFESFGLGKTAQEIEFCHQVVMHERVNDNPNAKALIVLRWA
ncbi:MAG: hypothetical protein ACLS7Z_00205 [Christensenellales bacterium]